MGPRNPKSKRVRPSHSVKSLSKTKRTSDEALAAQTVPGIDLQQVLHEFENALAIAETASNSLRSSPVTIGQLRSEVLALSQGVKALRAVGRTLNLVIVRVKP